MTFIEALKTGRPIRRKWSNVNGPWLHLGEAPGAISRPQWRRIDTGDAVGLARHEYLAEDWEAMP